jgi:hypothetical protein
MQTTWIIHPYASVIGAVRIAASYEDGSIVRAVSEYIETSVNIHRSTSTNISTCSFCIELIQQLHDLFLTHGDRSEYRQRYGADAYGWYLAACELSLLHIEHFRVTFCHIGGLHVFMTQRGTLQRVAPVHNVHCELLAQTIEDSCLAPFTTRSQRAIATQLLVDVPEAYIHMLAQLDPSTFYKKIGHMNTRRIGYFVDARQPHMGGYRQVPPVPACGQVQVHPNDVIFLYVPQLQEEVSTYDEAAIVRSIQYLSQQPVHVQHDFAPTPMQCGQALAVAISDHGMIHTVWVAE